jgi:iron complex outermembrane recepter protein
MFKLSLVAGATLVALSSQMAFAAETSTKDDDVEIIEVKGIRSSLNEALNVKRHTVQIVDAIVAEDIGKFPDNNVVESLQRVTGVQVTDRGAGEVNTVTIRGLNDVTTTVNGRNIFTAAGRSVALADVPASLLNRVDVYKTRSASQIGSGIAGQIDISTHRPFNFEDSKLVVAARGIYQESAESVDPTLSMLLSDRWEVGAGEFGALFNISYTETNFRDQSVTPGAAVPFRTGEADVPYERLFSGWTPGLEQGLPYTEGSTLNIDGQDVPYLLSRDAIFASDFTGKRERPAMNLSLQFAPNDWSEYIFEAFYNGYRNESFNSLLFSFVDWWGEAGNLPAPEVYPGTNVIKSRQVLFPYGFNSGDLTVSKTDSYVYALGGSWDLTDQLSVNAEVVYQKSEFETEFFAMRTDRVHYGVDVDFNTGNGIPSWQFLDNPNTADVDETDMTDPSLWNVAQLYDNGGASSGDALTLTTDGVYHLDQYGITSIKFGLRYDKRTAEDSTRGVDGFLGQSLAEQDEGLISINENFFDGRADIPASWAVADGYYIYDNREQFRDLYNFSDEDLVLETTFDIEEVTTSLYLEAEFETELAGKRFDGQVGLRYEGYENDMTFYDIDQNPVAVSTASIDGSNILPSLIARYHLTDDIIARFAYTETIRRPGFGQLNSFTYYFEDVTDIGYGTASGGNPDLQPVESTNLDLSLEWYFAEASSIYGTWFNRDIKGFVFDSLQRITHKNDEGEPYDYIKSTPANSSNGELSGFEFGTVLFPESWNGFGVQASATLLDSSQDLPEFDDVGNLTGYTKREMFGVSESSYSTVLIYENEDFDARLSYVWRDDFLNNYEAALFANPRGVYRKPETSMDFQISYDLSENLTVSFDATNLTNEYYQSYYQDSDIYNLGNAIFSRTFALGVRYSM